jgi:effector-binding domain-containing protein
METMAKYTVKEITWPEKVFFTKRARIAFDKLPAFFGQSYGEIYGTVQKLGIKATEPPCAIYYSIDEVKKETDLAAAVPVQGPVQDMKAFKKVIIPKSKVLATTHYGSYENMRPAYAELEKYLTTHGYKKELMIEEYLSDPAVEKDPGKWKTNIYFVVK